MLKAKGAKQSMSRKGNCVDNAVLENFFGLLKSDLIDFLGHYNNRRIKAELKGLTSAQHRYQAL